MGKQKVSQMNHSNYELLFSKTDAYALFVYFILRPTCVITQSTYVYKHKGILYRYLRVTCFPLSL